MPLIKRKRSIKIAILQVISAPYALTLGVIVETWPAFLLFPVLLIVGSWLEGRMFPEICLSPRMAIEWLWCSAYVSAVATLFSMIEYIIGDENASVWRGSKDCIHAAKIYAALTLRGNWERIAENFSASLNATDTADDLRKCAADAIASIGPPISIDSIEEVGEDEIYDFNVDSKSEADSVVIVRYQHARNQTSRFILSLNSRQGCEIVEYRIWK